MLEETLNTGFYNLLKPKQLSSICIIYSATWNKPTRFTLSEQVERADVFAENDLAAKEGKNPAIYNYVLLGITKPSLSTDSFIFAALF